MKGFLKDKDGQLSSKRLINLLSGISGVVLAWVAAIIAIKAKGDIGQNTMVMILSMIGVASTIGVVGNVVEKKKK